MAKEEIAEKIRNPLTLRAFIIGLAISIVASFIATWAQGISSEIVPMTNDRTVWIMIIMVILSLFITPLLKSMAFSAGELTIIYVMTMTNAFAGNLSYGTIQYPLAALYSTTVGAAALQWMPEIWFPKDPNIWQPMLTGGAAVPWGVWMIPMLYWITFQLCLIGIGLAFGFILRRSIIDVERLPFPFTQVMEPMVVNPERSLKERISVPLLLVGFLVGFIIQGTYTFFPKVIPGWVDFWPRDLWGVRGYDFGPILGANIYRNQMLLFFFDYAIWAFCIYFLLPTKILGSALLVHFIWGNIIPYVEVSLGMVTNLGNFGVYSLLGWYATMVGTLFEPTGIQWYSVLTLGFPIGFVFTYIFFARREIYASLKDALKGVKSESITWILFAVTILGYLALHGVVGVTLTTSLVFLVLSFTYITLSIKLRGETIVDSVPVFANTLQLSWETTGGEAARNTPQMFKNGLMCGVVMTNSLIKDGRSPAWAPLEGMRLLEMSGKKWDWKPLVLVVVISLVANLFVSWIVNLWGTYKYGQLVKWMLPIWSGSYTSDINGSFSNALLSPGSYATGTASLRPIEIFSGSILGIAITALNSMFAWWPLHPLGFLIGIDLGWGRWNWVLLAFIARVIILKVGGSKLYNKAVQVVLGSLIGWAVMSILEFIIMVAGY